MKQLFWQSLSNRKASTADFNVYNIPINDTPFELHVFWQSDTRHRIKLGPVVQSIVSLTSSLRGQLVKCFATL